MVQRNLAQVGPPPQVTTSWASICLPSVPSPKCAAGKVRAEPTASSGEVAEYKHRPPGATGSPEGARNLPAERKNLPIWTKGAVAVNDSTAIAL